MSVLTGETAEQIVKMIPEDVEEAYLFALLMTIIDVHTDDVGDGLGFIVTLAIRYAQAHGRTSEQLSDAFRQTSDFLRDFQFPVRTSH